MKWTVAIWTLWLTTAAWGQAGCTYLDGDNYDPDATWDDGSCTLFQYTNPCPGDFNFDGWIATSDLLLFLGVFGEGC